MNPANPINFIKTECFSFPNPSHLLGNAGRKPLTGPGLVNLDFSIFKNFPVRKISGSARIQFRAEFFNILNHPNFGPPIDNALLAARLFLEHRRG